MSGTFTRRHTTAAAIFTAVLTALAAVAIAQQPAFDLDSVLERVGQRVDEYYKRIENIICMERVVAQPINGNSLSPEGFARVLDYELHVERGEANADGDADDEDPRFVRELKKVNGRTPRDKDTPGCFDPNPLTLAPLAFLLPTHREHYTFTIAGVGKGKDANALIVEYRRREREKPAFVDDPKGRADCFSISLGSYLGGRVWIDRDTYNVLRVEEHLTSRLDVAVPYKSQADHNLPNVVVVERYDTEIRYKPVAFQDPDESILLPQEITALAVLHGAGSHRRQQVFSNYRRFLTRGRLVK